MPLNAEQRPSARVSHLCTTPVFTFSLLSSCVDDIGDCTSEPEAVGCTYQQWQQFLPNTQVCLHLMGSAASTTGAPTRVLVIGAEGAGKTLLLRQLANRAKRGKQEVIDMATVPSVGTELMQIMAAKCNFLCREMGGSMIPVWPRYYQESHAVIFVIDGSSEAHLASATIELLTALKAPTLTGKPFAVVFNKCDVPVQIPQTTFETIMRIDDIIALQESVGRPTACFRCSASTADGVVEILDWLVAQSRGKARGS